ncbi:MAG: protein O-mannosyl-transferase family [Acidobacteriota bacterium]
MAKPIGTSGGSRVFWSHVLFLVLLAVLFVATTVPFGSRFPVSWDAGQFVLGMHHFSVTMHQPHIPGYPLFIGLGRVLHWLLPVHTSLVVVSGLFAAAALAALYWFTWTLSREPWLCLVTSVLFLVNPVFWFYREAALTYTVDAFATILVGALSYRALTGRGSLSYPAAVILGLVGGVRPSVIILLLPVLLFPSLARRRFRQIPVMFLLLAATVLVWLVPLIVLSGGWAEYQSSARQVTVRQTSFLLGGEVRITVDQSIALIEATIGGLNVVLLPAFAGAWLWFAACRESVKKPPVEIGFFIAWVVPALLFFGLVHFGQVGYLLIVLPPAFALAARAWLAASRLHDSRRRFAALAILSVLLIGHGVTFPLFSWELADRLSHRQGPLGWTFKHLVRFGPVAFSMNADAIRANDSRMQALTEIVRRYPPDRTLVVCGWPLEPRLFPKIWTQPDPFRTLAVTCPDHFIADVNLEGSFPTAKGFKTGRMPDNSTFKGIDRAIFLFEEIPETMLPQGLLLEQRMFRDQPYYEGKVRTDFEFRGTRFKVGDGK